MPRFHSGAAIDRPETTKLPPIPEVVWKQPQETHLIDIHKNSTTNINNSTHTPELERKDDAESQTSPIKEILPQVTGSDTEAFLETQFRKTPVHCPNNSTKRNPENQRNEKDMTTNDIVDDNISAPKMTTSQIEAKLVTDQFTNELYMSLSSTIVLKRKKETLYVPLVFENGLTIDALVDSRAYVSALAQNELDRIEQQASANILRISDPPHFPIETANGQLEKSIATATLKLILETISLKY